MKFEIHCKFKLSWVLTSKWTNWFPPPPISFSWRELNNWLKQYLNFTSNISNCTGLAPGWSPYHLIFMTWWRERRDNKCFANQLKKLIKWAEERLRKIYHYFVPQILVHHLPPEVPEEEDQEEGLVDDRPGLGSLLVLAGSRPWLALLPWSQTEQSERNLETGSTSGSILYLHTAPYTNRNWVWIPDADLCWDLFLELLNSTIKNFLLLISSNKRITC